MILFANTSGTNIMPLLISALCIGILFYFMIVRPQKKNAAKHQAMIEGLSQGDEIITSGGIYGTITNIDDDTVQVKVSAESELKIAKKAIAMKKVDSTTNSEISSDSI